MHDHRTGIRPRRAWRWAAVALAWFVRAPSAAEAATLEQTDLALALYASPDAGASWNPLSATALKGFFGPHRCWCPDTLAVLVQLTDTGKSKLGASTVAAAFLLGNNCAVSPTSCYAIGQVSFTSTQTAASPTFSSDLVFKMAAGTSTVACGSLTAGSTEVWAILAQDGVALPFALGLAVPVLATTVGAPTSVTAQPANQGLLVSWAAPSNPSLVAGYQVLCLPRPGSASSAGYESCGLTTTTTATTLTPADATQLCSDVVSSSTTSVRVTGLVNGTPYTVAVVAIDEAGGVSAVSPTAQAVPQETIGFYERYKDAGGAATGCTVVPGARAQGAGWLAGLAVLVLALSLRRRRTLTIVVVLAGLGGTAQAQIARYSGEEDWTSKPSLFATPPPVEWGLELGVSLYRPAIDDEFGNGARPYADTFGNSRHLMSEVELDYYFSHRGAGAWGVGLRFGYFKTTGAAFLADGSRSGDETGLRIVPCSLSLVYRASELPGIRHVLVPYVKAGLDGWTWTASSTGGDSQTGMSLGWHVTGGTLLSLAYIAGSGTQPGAIAGPGALFFEWSYAAINGLGMTHALHVGDSTWFAGLMFDL